MIENVSQLIDSLWPSVTAWLAQRTEKSADKLADASEKKLLALLEKNPDVKQTAASAESRPESEGRRSKLKAELLLALEEDEVFRREVEAFLQSEPRSSPSVTQTAETKGDNNVNAQVAGQGNTISIGRSS